MKTHHPLFERLQTGLQEGVAHVRGGTELRTTEISDDPSKGCQASSRSKDKRGTLRFVLCQLPVVLGLLICTVYAGIWIGLAFDAHNELSNFVSLWKGVGCLGLAYCLICVFLALWDE